MAIRALLLAYAATPIFLGSAGSGDSCEAMDELRTQYLSTVRMGLLGGLDHGAVTDPNHGATTNPNIRNECLMRDLKTGVIGKNCIMKWDGNERMLRIEDLYNKVRQQQIPGDLVECGVWRGGITVYMRALLQAHEDESRRVWVSDSFNGVPNAARQAEGSKIYDIPARSSKEDKRWGHSVVERGLDGSTHSKNILTVEQELVTDNFKRFGLLDDRVKIVPGYFNDSLPEVSKQGLTQIAILRVDGDLYSSTMDVLINLYKFVSPGGWIVLDDYPLKPSRDALNHFLKQNNLDPDLLIKTDRITAETISDDVSNKDINKCAYFQKPFP